jgi:hypothetical protein
MFEWFKRLWCNHEWRFVGHQDMNDRITGLSYNAQTSVCRKCGKTETRFLRMN